TAGCAATPPKAASPRAEAAGPASSNAPERNVGVVAIKSLAEPASIRAGESRSGRTLFFTAAGQLTADIAAYARDVSRTRQVPLDVVTDLLLQAQYNPTAVKLMRPTSGRIKRSWATYRQRNVDPV